jgi:ergothioneine biosynthesis protein EgtB
VIGDDAEQAASELSERYRAVRETTLRLCAPLATEDYVVQSMADASPAKWHLAHTTWFFERFVLAGSAPYRADWDALFNSYYETIGRPFTRAARGLLTRPTVSEVRAYRAFVDEAVAALLSRARPASEDERALMELGLAHEQQHQELLLTDLQHAFSCNPLQPVYRERAPVAPSEPVAAVALLPHAGGLCAIGDNGSGFAFDNERPRHRVHLQPFAIADRAVTAREYLAFMEGGGYERPELWLSEGWDRVKREGWRAPLYWEQRDGEWLRFSLHGLLPVELDAPVCHVSYFEADAYARFAGMRLPTEAEWEVLARELPIDGQFLEEDGFVPVARAQRRGLCGGAWSWTSSAYSAYPGFVPGKGALGEYNGKFMVSQMVLRGGSCFTPRDHIRTSYRNFFPPHTRWQVTGIRLAQ